MDKTLKLIEHAVTLLDEEIQITRPAPPSPQLVNIREEMQAIVEVLRSGNLPQKANRVSGIRRMIVDEWPTDSQLGNQLLDALSGYHAL